MIILDKRDFLGKSILIKKKYGFIFCKPLRIIGVPQNFTFVMENYHLFWIDGNKALFEVIINDNEHICYLIDLQHETVVDYVDQSK
jgi:hypothetical protein